MFLVYWGWLFILIPLLYMLSVAYFVGDLDEDVKVGIHYAAGWVIAAIVVSLYSFSILKAFSVMPVLVGINY